MTRAGRVFGWPEILRVGLVQAAIGSLVVLTTSTMNRIMMIELALPALVPGALIAFHYAIQFTRPHFGFGCDRAPRFQPRILLGMAILGCGVVGASGAIALAGTHRTAGIAAAVLAFACIGTGVGAAGTALLTMVAKSVPSGRKGIAGTAIWIMMIFGFAVTTAVVGSLIDPYSPARLVVITACVAVIAWLITFAATWRLEIQGAADATSPNAVSPSAQAQMESASSKPSAESTRQFRDALREIWADTAARRFTIFVLLSMIAFSAQDLILEPFAGALFGMTPGQTTRLGALQHGGTLIGMLLAGWLSARRVTNRTADLSRWMIVGCCGSAIVLAVLSAQALGLQGNGTIPVLFGFLGVTNGIFAISAIASMMELAGAGGSGREGIRMGVWGAAQAVGFAVGGLTGTGSVDLGNALFGSSAAGYAGAFGVEAALFGVAALFAARLSPAHRRARAATGPATSAPAGDASLTDFDVVVVGGGPSGSTAAWDLARAGRSVLLLDRAGRIKPCGGAVPPRLLSEFEIPASLLVARARSARMFSPLGRQVDMPIDTGFVGMVDRDVFDEWLRVRAADAGATRVSGDFRDVSRDARGNAVIEFNVRNESDSAVIRRVTARSVIGADGATSKVAERCLPADDKPSFVFAYHEIIRSPAASPQVNFDASRCDVHYRGGVSPDFYGWVFPHGETTSVGVGSAHRGFSLRGAVEDLRRTSGLDAAATVRREGAPIPLKPRRRWDNGRDTVVAGDAAGVVAPASGEGIYYAMASGRWAAEAVDTFLTTGRPADLKLARRRFMRAHGRVFFILGILQRFWYSSDRRRERFVSLCRDRDIQRLTWQAYLYKRLERTQPMAHVRIFFKDLAHLVGIVPP